MERFVVVFRLHARDGSGSHVGSVQDAHHLRSNFYTDDFFTAMPNVEEDAMPMANLIKARQPDILVNLAGSLLDSQVG